ncbi:3,4-dihydroxy-2-butanone-4-phosphate synthase [Rhizobium leucaenae]|jgi:3,4-dihydroxy-2-butanone 4-phosphate synthase|uniref:3,4-dihydroxy-2-butanone 4-phosphate synthase n=1 Tax=Rhizobium leucaenae TaxID=29450 RepID=A0A7W7EPS5_9HYPH|nr:3,4-dihydroxy-2-butanone-4-phosphate synthase [Rhizobium leucaenae]MBB4571533.1 3,4-dihydroxy-2-butanone 4-phosphate synthase [Rhizobium leucaenae]
MAFSLIEDAIAAIGRGEIILVAGNRHRENEGDLVIASELVTSEAIP